MLCFLCQVGPNNSSGLLRTNLLTAEKDGPLLPAIGKKVLHDFLALDGFRGTPNSFAEYFFVTPSRLPKLKQPVILLKSRFNLSVDVTVSQRSA